MILRMPTYCKDFLCIADRCGDNCCIGWEIGIDPETAEYYRSIGGEFGNKLKKSISHDNCFILGENERCPFLNEENLCEIIINLGNDKLCQICNNHPRYYEWFEGIKEGGIGFCCEEAARIILSQTSPLSFTETEIDYENADYYNSELYNYLYDARKIILEHIQNENLPFSKRMCDILDFTEKLQSYADNCDYTIPEMKSAEISFKHDLKGILKFLLTLEPIDDNWKPYLKSRIDMYDNVVKHKINNESQIKNYLRNISVYFVWRYFLKGVFDEEFLSRIKLMAISVAVVAYLFVCHQIESNDNTLDSYAMIIKNFSKEIEYNEENMEEILNKSYQLKYFSTEYLKGIFMEEKNENRKSG